jgi:O-antigen/teichoic acid export membrane protein
VGGYTSSLGVYNAAIQISASLAVVIITPLYTTLLPEASSSSTNGGGVSNVLRLSIPFLMLVLLPASLLVVAGLATQLLTLFSGGGSYLAAVSVLQIISVLYLFYGIQYVLTSILQNTGLTVQALIVGAAAALADLGFALLLVPSSGILEERLAESLKL